MSRPPEDAGLAAVVRVRGVRERDSRLDLRDATAAREHSAARVARLEEPLRRPVPVAGTAADFGGWRTGLVELHGALEESRAELQARAAEAGDALARWRAASTRLAAVERLAAARAVRRAEARARAEAASLDDIAATAWLRRRSR